METPNEPAPTGWRPTNSTNITALAGGLTWLTMFVCAKFNIEFTGPDAAGLTALIMAVANFIHPDGGRK
jgi:hypothetical protein